ncbi:hypothetical protein NKI38_04575 [Mesorhizobium sp. M0621]|uniref:hypothetical protein n=1 Tax=Mesorhizobium sp. M0621 TaxID=2956974 RepID=UPI0033370C92
MTMLPDNAFMRRLPIAVPLKKRLEVDAILTSTDIAFVAYDKIFDILTGLHLSQVPGIPLRTATELCLNAWAIVDSVHTLRQFAEKTAKPEGQMARFLKSCEHFTEMRNVMHHRAGQLGNAANTKAENHPTYGVVSFCSPIDSDQRFNMTQITLGTTHHERHRFADVDSNLNPSDKTITHVTLTAFDYQTDLSRVNLELYELIVSMNRQLQETILPQLTAAAEAAGEDLDKVLADYNGRNDIITVMMQFEGS